MTTEISIYEKQAKDFLNKLKIEFKAEFIKHGKHFNDDKESRDIYKLSLKRGNRVVSFDFGQSLNNSGFYYTKGVQKIDLDRKYLNNYGKGLGVFIKTKLDWGYLDNNKSDKIHYPIAPNEYDLLAGLTKNDVGTLEDFCSEFGYDEDSKKAEKTYNAVKEEYNKVCTIFNDEELTELQEIN